MVLQLDARVPRVWRSPSSLQFGIDPARVVLEDVSYADEHMVSALIDGISRSGLSMVGASAGATEPEVVRLLGSLSPVLAPTFSGVTSAGTGLAGSQAAPTDRPKAAAADADADATATATATATARRSATIAIVGSGATVQRIAQSLHGAGERVAVTSEPSRARCALAIAVGHFVLDPKLYGFWLRRDIPHLPVIFGDSGVTIGPIVEPGEGPCLYCLERHRSDADPAWPAIASQLWGRTSAVESPLVSGEVAARVARLALARLSAGVGGAATSVRINAADGRITVRTERPHPDCGCIVVASGAPRGTGSPRAPYHGTNPQRPTTPPASSGRG